MPDPLPIIALAEMEALCTKYGFNQVIVLARKVGEHGYENLGTHGTDMEHSNAAAAIGEHLRKDVLGWTESPEGKELVGERVALARAAPGTKRERDRLREVLRKVADAQLLGDLQIAQEAARAVLAECGEASDE